MRKPFLKEIPSPRFDKNNYCIGYIGGLEAWKGVDTIIDALQYLPENISTVFIGGKEGDDKHKRLMAKAEELGVKNRIHYRGYVPYPTLEKMIHDIDIFVLPLLEIQEGNIPMKLFDYLCLGKPIIASNQPSIKEVLKDGISALYFTPGSGRELAEQVNKLIRNPLLRYNLSLNAYQSIGFYTVDKWLEEMRSFLEII